MYFEKPDFDTLFNNVIFKIIGYIILILLFLWLIWGIFEKDCDAFEQKDIIAIYVVTTAEDLTIGWDKHVSEVPFHYDFHLYNYGEQSNYALGATQLNQITLKVPRTGLWVFYCRECDKPKSDNTRICSEYSHSDLIEFAQVKDPETGLYIPGAWMIYAHIAPPTDGGFEP